MIKKRVAKRIANPHHAHAAQGGVGWCKTVDRIHVRKFGVHTSFNCIYLYGLAVVKSHLTGAGGRIPVQKRNCAGPV